ncbi:hypothetical protein [Pseudoduganella namucuonensis]|uniref:Uncharacterized protein n=1 Tax=Pseudoduganella namucuonensis TaxID=1035707 RepID=A0A1I7LT35_9BURK|nr:hypothetical protein [Pseudoduganella namucuonensis]SFV12856.1 hypothetical protein SAMN05216552_103715 [Pseudoduganella namucuonensis]
MSVTQDYKTVTLSPVERAHVLAAMKYRLRDFKDYAEISRGAASDSWYEVVAEMEAAIKKLEAA